MIDAHTKPSESELQAVRLAQTKKSGCNGIIKLSILNFSNPQNRADRRVQAAILRKKVGGNGNA